jgi:hypothetical protein
VSFLFVDSLIREEERASICRDCGAGTVIGSSDLAPKIQAGRTEAGTVNDMILVNGETAEGTHSYSARRPSAPLGIRGFPVGVWTMGSPHHAASHVRHANCRDIE